MPALAAWLLVSGCADDGGPSGPGDDGQGAGPFSRATLEALAEYLTGEARAGRLEGAARHPAPRLGPPPQDLPIAIVAEAGEAITLVRIDPAALARDPITITADDLTVVSAAAAGAAVPVRSGAPAPTALRPADATPDAGIAAGVQALIDRMAEIGFDTTTLQQAVDDTEFHEDVVQTDGADLVTGTADAISFPIGLDETYALFGVWPYVILVHDGHSHTVFTEEDAASLRGGSIVGQDGKLTGAAETALHELIHIVLKQQGREDKDDDADAVVSALEHALVAKIHAEIARAETGEADGRSLNTFSTHVATLAGLNAADCLTLFGLSGVVAGEIVIDGPTRAAPGQTVEITVTAKTPGGEPVAGEDLVVQVGGTAAADPGFKVVRTDAEGRATLNVAAGAEAGSINLTARGLGGESERHVIDVAVAEKVSLGIPGQPGAGDLEPGEHEVEVAAGFGGPRLGTLVERFVANGNFPLLHRDQHTVQMTDMRRIVDLREFSANGAGSLVPGNGSPLLGYTQYGWCSQLDLLEFAPAIVRMRDADGELVSEQELTSLPDNQGTEDDPICGFVNVPDPERVVEVELDTFQTHVRLIAACLRNAPADDLEGPCRDEP